MESFKLLERLRRDNRDLSLFGDRAHYFDHVFKVKTPKSAPNLEALIVELIELSGGVCTKIYTGGRQITTKKKVSNILNHERHIIDTKYIPGTTAKGTSDLIACIKGKYYALEVKFSKSDRQSEYQKEFQKKVVSSGGVYLIINTLDDILPLIH